MADKKNQDEEPTFSQKCSTGCANFGKFMWNSERKEFMGRTGSSWAKIGLFYLIFYGCLAGFFAGMLAVFMTTITQPGDGAPKLTQFIKNQPGLNRLDKVLKKIPTLKEYYNASHESYVRNYTEGIQEFLDLYNVTDYHSNKTCKKVNEGMPVGKPCIFDLTLFGPCNKKNSFGLKDRKPCIFVMINKVYGWVPESDNGYLKLACEGATVYPEGFLIGAFPFRGQDGYVQPLVAVEVDTTGGKPIDVECKLEGKNIEVSESSKPSRAYGRIKLEGVSSVAK